MSDSSESSTASNSRITKLGLQLGMLAALDSAQRPRSNMKKERKDSALVSRRTSAEDTVEGSRLKTHQVKMKTVNDNLKEINTRFSVFDSFLLPAAVVVNDAISRTTSSAAARATSPHLLQQRSLSPRHSPRSKSPMLAQRIAEATHTALQPPSADASRSVALAGAGAGAGLPESKSITVVDRSTELRVSSPLRVRYQSVLYNKPYEGREPVPKATTYEIRVSFWSAEELQRMSSYLQSPLRYGIDPAFVDLFVPETANPREMLAVVLSRWRWDNLHAFRFVGASAGTDGRRGRCYEGKAAVPDPAAPAMSQFGLYTGAQCFLTYDPSGDNWQWMCTCLKVHVSSDIRIAPTAPVKITLVQQCGELPAQYLWQFEQRFGSFSSKFNSLEDSSRAISADKSARGLARENVVAERKQTQDATRVEPLEHHAWYDENGKYFESTLAKVVQIFRERYMARSIADVDQLHQERLGALHKEGEGIFF